MQSTGQTSTHASQPVQLSAQTTASSLGSFLRAFPAPLAMSQLLCFGSMVPLLLYEVPARGALVGQVCNLPLRGAGFQPACLHPGRLQTCLGVVLAGYKPAPRRGRSPVLFRQPFEGVAELARRLVAQVGVALDRLEQEGARRLVEVGAQLLG